MPNDEGLPENFDALQAEVSEAGFVLTKSSAVPDWWEKAVIALPVAARMLGFLHWNSDRGYVLVVAEHLDFHLQIKLAIEAEKVIDLDDAADQPHDEWTWMSDGSRFLGFLDGQP